jgi:large subunit ribosomal protein L21
MAANGAAHFHRPLTELAVDLAARLNIVPPRFDAGLQAARLLVCSAMRELPHTKAGRMYAVIKTGGKQYKVAKNDVILVEKLPGEAGAALELDEVLLVGDDNSQTVGSPLVDGAHVAATVLEQTRGEKIIVFKKKRRQNYRRKAGHRQDLTALKITDIVTGGKKKVAKAAEPKAEEKKAAPKAEEKKVAPKAEEKKAAPKAEEKKAEAKAAPKKAEAKAAPKKAEAKPAAKKAEAKPAAKKAPAKKTEAKASAKPAAEKKPAAKKAPAKKPAAKKKD